MSINSVKATAYVPDEYIKLQGLEPDGIYTIDGTEYDGGYLMSNGIIIRNDIEHFSKTFIVKRA